MQDTIIEAMRKRHALEFSYDGAPRVVNPHALYRDTKHQKPVLLAWQTDGTSNTRVPPCWGNFHLDKIVDLAILDETSITRRPEFNPKRYKGIIHSL